MTPTPHTPSAGFAFPDSVQNAIGNSLGDKDQTDAMLRKELAPEPFQGMRKAKPVVRMVNDDNKPVIPVEGAIPSPVASPDAVSIDLPSKFHYYTFKDLYVKPMRTMQLAKIAKAHETGNLQTQVEAISSLLFTPTGEKDIAFKLTMADYTAVLYWLRMNSFPKPTMRVRSSCQDSKHIADVEARIKPQESLIINTTVHKSDLRTNYLNEAPDPEYYSIVVDGIRIPFGPETLSDTIQFLSHDLWTDEEFQFKSRLAAVLKLDQATGKVWTWDQRIQFVDEYLDLGGVVKAQEFASLVDTYGLVETVETHCKGCGSKGVTTISCDPLSFLSPEF